MARKRLVVGAAVALAVAGAGPAFAGTSSTSTVTVAAVGGSLDVTIAGPAAIAGATLGAAATGSLPVATWSDLTGTGAGWNGTVQVSNLTYTGTWTASGVNTGVVLSTGATDTGSYTGTDNGVTYTVTSTDASGGFSYTSNATGDTSGTGTATAGTPTAVGTQGLLIDFTTLPTAAGESWTIKVGTQAADAFTYTGSTIVGVNPPVATNTSSAITGGGVGTLGSSLKILSAAAGTGQGSFTVTPNVSVTLDANSWAATYGANVQYTIASGP